MKNIFYVIVVALALYSCGGSKSTTATKPSRKQPAAATEPTTGRIVQLQTEFGNMTLALSDSTPKHRDNFIKLVKQGFYDSLLFHRVINQFMIQGGDPTSKNAQPGQFLGSGGLDYRVPAEFVPSLFHRRGALAAARDGNPEKASSPCQFYIVQGRAIPETEINYYKNLRRTPLADSAINIYKTQGGTPQLDENYTVFGQVISGYEVIDKIATLITDGNNRPKKDVRMRMIILR